MYEYHNTDAIVFGLDFWSKDGKLQQLPDLRKATNIFGELRYWQELIYKQSELFCGDSVLISEEKLNKAEHFLNKWMDATSMLVNRHSSSANDQKYKDVFSHRQLRMV